MPNTSKSSKKAAKVTAAPKPEFADAFTPLVLNSVARVADLQKQTLDIAAQQTAEWLGAWKNAFSYLPVTPPTFVFDVASQAVQTAIETQKSAIDLVVEQTHSAAGIAKVRAEAYSKIVDGVTNSVQRSVARLVEVQNRVLDFAAEQNKTIVESTKKQLGTSAGPATILLDSFHRGSETMIAAQKSLLSAASQPFVASTKN